MNAPQPPGDGIGTATQAWMQRTGARQRNFRNYVVEVELENGYTDAVATAKIVDGEFVFSGDAAYKPTEEEADAIAAEISA